MAARNRLMAGALAALLTLGGVACEDPVPEEEADPAGTEEEADNGDTEEEADNGES